MTDARVKRSIVAVAMVLVVLALASFASSSAWATPAQDALRQTIPTRRPTPPRPPQSIVLPPQPGGDDYSFVYVPLPPVDNPPPVGCEIYSPFRIEAYLGTELVYPENFDPPLEICVTYTAEQAEENGGAENLSVVYWDEELQQWIPLDNRRHDAELSQLCGDVSFLAANNIFAITCVVSPTAVPVTGHGSGEVSSAVVVALLAALAGAGFLVLMRRSNAEAS